MIYEFYFKRKNKEYFFNNSNQCCTANLTTKDPNIANLSKRIDIMNSQLTSASNTLSNVDKQVSEVKELVSEINNRAASYEQKAQGISKSINDQAIQNQKNQQKSKKQAEKLEMFTVLQNKIDIINSQGIF